jgi:hypothetical protein
LQMLDALVFRSFKHMLRDLHAKARALSPSGTLDAQAWIECLGEAIMNHLVHKDWSQTFAAQGLTMDVADLTPRVAQVMLHPVETLAALGAQPLNDDELSRLIGTNRRGIARRFNDTPVRIRQRSLAVAKALAAPVPAAPPALPAPMQLPRGHRLPGWSLKGGKGSGGKGRGSGHG